MIMRVFVGLLCVAAAAKTVDDTTIREAVTAWFADRAAAEAKYGHINIASEPAKVEKRCSRRVGEDGVPALEACKQTCGKC